MMNPATWLHQLPVFVQYILALVMADWLAVQCWLAQRVLLEVAHERPNT